MGKGTAYSGSPDTNMMLVVMVFQAIHTLSWPRSASKALMRLLQPHWLGVPIAGSIVTACPLLHIPASHLHQNLIPSFDSVFPLSQVCNNLSVVVHVNAVSHMQLPRFRKQNLVPSDVSSSMQTMCHLTQIMYLYCQSVPSGSFYWTFTCCWTP